MILQFSILHFINYIRFFKQLFYDTWDVKKINLHYLNFGIKNYYFLQKNEFQTDE